MDSREVGKIFSKIFQMPPLLSVGKLLICDQFKCGELLMTKFLTFKNKV